MNVKWFEAKGLKCVVICGGKGERLNPLTGDIAKSMVAVGDRPIVHYIIDYWKKYTRDFVFVVGYKKEGLMEYIGQLPINSTFVIEKGPPQGIANALSLVREKIKDRFIMVLGDCVCKGEFNFPEDMEQGVGVFETEKDEDILRSYSIEVKEGEIVKVVEKPKEIVNRLCGLGFYFFDRRVFDYIEQTPPSPLKNQVELTNVIQTMIDAKEKISPVFLEGQYLNITYPPDLKIAEGMF